MKLMLKTGLILATVFASTFILSRIFDIISFESIRQVLYSIQSQPDILVGGVIALLLFLDIFIAVPTLTVVLLSGYFLGFFQSILYVFPGLFAAAMTGYFISAKWGEGMLNLIEKDPEEKIKMKKLFVHHGTTMLILSRAMPILPEITASLAGICKMPLKRFISGWFLGTIPYMLIGTYTGSISDMDNPSPAIFGAIIISGTLWLSWAYFFKKKSAQI